MAITSAYPNLRTGDAQRDVDGLRDVFIAFLDEINQELENISAECINGNLQNATIEADNITTDKARIKSAQIAELIADKIIAGTLNLDNNITISGSNGIFSMYIDSSAIVITERISDTEEVIRYKAGYDYNAGKFIFLLQNMDGTRGIGMDDNGNMAMTGELSTGLKNQARVVIDGAGINSYNSANKLNGLSVNPSDLTGAFRLYCNGSNVFTINYATALGQGFLSMFGAGDKAMLTNVNGQTDMSGIWRYPDDNSGRAKQASELVTQKELGDLRNRVSELERKLS